MLDVWLGSEYSTVFVLTTFFKPSNKPSLSLILWKEGQHSVHPPLSSGGEGEGVEPPTQFSKKGLDRTSIFRGVTFSGGLKFLHKK